MLPSKAKRVHFRGEAETNETQRETSFLILLLNKPYTMLSNLGLSA